MNLVNIITQSQTPPVKVGSTFNPDLSTLVAGGWRIRPDVPEVAKGYERLTGVTYAEGDGKTACAVYADTLIQDRLDREAVEIASAAKAKEDADKAAIEATTARDKLKSDIGAAKDVAGLSKAILAWINQ